MDNRNGKSALIGALFFCTRKVLFILKFRSKGVVINLAF
jgi:hypothetical protein